MSDLKVENLKELEVEEPAEVTKNKLVAIFEEKCLSKITSSKFDFFMKKIKLFLFFS